MSHAHTITAEVERFKRLFSGIAAHVEEVAYEYHKSREKHGKPIEDAMVKSGFDRSWLRCLEDIGTGHAKADILFIDPAKREILRQAPIAVQEAVMKDGINGKPITATPIDVIRKQIANAPERITRQVPVMPHSRKFPSARPERKQLPGLRLRGQRFTWQEVRNALVRAIENGEVPADILIDIADTCERSKNIEVLQA